MRQLPLRDRLVGLDREQLQALLLTLAERDPGLTDLIEGDIALLAALPSAAATAQTAPRASIDVKAIRREIRAIHRGQGGSLDALLKQAETFLVAGDHANALALLETLTDENVAEESFESWEGREDWEEEPTSFFDELGPIWAEALLSGALTKAERAAWAAKLEAWRENAAQYGYEEGFDLAIAAAQQGWDDPALTRILQGQSDGQLSHAGEARTWDEDQEDLTEIRLAILDRQGRFDEYLNLAAAADRIAAYTTMLVRLDRVREAVDYGLEHLTTPGEALTLARALQERGDAQSAMRIAEHGMTLSGLRGALAPWLRDLAAARGDTRQAAAAAVVTFEEAPSLSNYLRVREVDEEGFPARRAALLDHLRALPPTYYPEAPVDIFLHEGLIEDAIAAVDQGATHTLVERVADAAVPSHPDWVIKTARGQAERLMDGGKSQYYDAAARWLARVRDAYRAAGREQEWQAYRQELLAQHGRKRKLVPLLQALR
jgi:uncharacterized Zn finger protein